MRGHRQIFPIAPDNSFGRTAQTGCLQPHQRCSAFLLAPGVANRGAQRDQPGQQQIQLRRATRGPSRHMADNPPMARPVPRMTAAEIERVIATAWDDRPPYKAVLVGHGLTPGQMVQLLKRELTPNAFKVWTARTRSPLHTAHAAASRAAPKRGR